MSRFFDAVEKTALKHQELLKKLETSSLSGDYQKANKINQELKKIGLIVEKYNEYKVAKSRIKSALDIIESEKDHDIIELAEEEIQINEGLANRYIKELKLLMIPRDVNDEKNVIIEIRGAAGGDEANIFCGDLFRLYSRYSENMRYEIEILNSYPANQGGFTQISFMVKGKGAYSRLKFENGVHRVQRVPRTESQGRTHTSTASVVVMPEIKESELVINPAELRIDTYRSSGSGGQHVNKTDSAVRMTHLPTGIVAASQDGRSQHDNRDKAMRQLRAKIQESIDKAKEKELKEIRLKSVGSGDRSEKIRTYNYPQNRITDHRISLTLMKLDVVMEGNLDEIIEALVAFEQEEKLEQTSF